MTTDISFDSNGNVTSLKYGSLEFAAPENDPQGLFILQFRDFIGNPLRISQGDFSKCIVAEAGEGKFQICHFDCIKIPGMSVIIDVSRKEDGIHWNISTEYEIPHIKMEWVDFPRLRMTRQAAAEWLLPIAEGTLIPDLELREKYGNFKCEYAEYPMTGVSSFYPGPLAMQFEACFCDDGGLFILCADPGHSPKSMDVHTDGTDACRLMFQHFTGGENSPGYDVVFAGYRGGWQEAAELYRNWMEEKDTLLPPKLCNTIPQLLADSPVFMIYPVKGSGRDCGDLPPNEYYPYVNILPVVERYREMWGGTFVTLLMHWEGTAPWAPPYIWPPFGGEKELKDFIDTMHRNGDQVGLYAYGIGWTMKSMTEKTFCLEEHFQQKHVENEICIGPRHEMYSRVCNGLRGQRLGYDLCPAREFTGKVVQEEISKAAACGVDYLQYFDQNQGGAAPLCYAKNHGHPELPGAWETMAMRKLFHKAVESGNGMVIGCENAAAQPYVDSCKLNDLRYHLAWGACGIPVPLYPFLFHEYTSGFSGNGVCLSFWIDTKETPFFLLWQLAWNFAYGNILSVVLKDGGKIHWNWGLSWSMPEPEQAPLLELMKNLTYWRRKLSKNYLASGRMLKVPEVDCKTLNIFLKHGKIMKVPGIISAAWQGIDGSKIILLVNCNGSEESCNIRAGGVIRHRDGSKTQTDGSFIIIPAYDAIAIELSQE